MPHARKIAFWLPALLWAGLISFLSSQSRFPDKDKIEHLVFYTIFWFCLLLPLRYGHRLSLANTIVSAFLITFAYGASDEFHQRFVPNRSCKVPGLDSRHNRWRTGRRRLCGL